MLPVVETGAPAGIVILPTKFAPYTLPPADNIPGVTTLPPDRLPTRLPTKLAAVILPPADIVPTPMMLPPTILADDVIDPPALTIPAVSKLPPVILPTETIELELPS